MQPHPIPVYISPISLKNLFYICRYHSLAPMYYRGAQAAIVVYDIQNQDSFQRAKTWVKELQRQV